MSILENFFIREYGRKQDEAATIVFLHGLLGWGLNWNPILKYFSDEFHILIYDQRGHGRSFHPPNGFAPEDYAQDLLDILSAKNIDKAHLVGHSLGARTVQCFAAQYPSKTSSLILEDMGPNPAPESTKATQEMIVKVPVPFSSKEEMDHYFNSEFKIKTSSEDTEKIVMANFLKANLKRNKSGQIVWRVSLHACLESLEQGLIPRWSEYKCLDVPTLILRGENSKHLSQETYDLMLESLALAKGVVVQDAGHWIHYQKPQVFSDYVLEFLRKLS